MTRIRYRRRKLAWILSACSGVFLLIGASGLTVEEPGSSGFAFSVVLTVIAIVLVVRTFRMATVLVDDQKLTIRGFLRTRHVRWPAIREIVPLDMPNMYGMAGATLTVVMEDGKRITLGEFWSRSGPGTLVDTMVRELNSMRLSRSNHRVS